MRMAELCDLSTSFIAEIETGKKFPSSSSIERIAAALSVRPYQLFLEGEEHQKIDALRVVAKASRELKAKVSERVDELARKFISELGG